MAVGGASLKIARHEDRLIALIPLLFGIQQCFEGIQWVHLDRGIRSLSAGYAFLFFALLLWPVYVPAALFTIDPTRRKVLTWYIVAGGIVSLAYLVALATQPLGIAIVNQHIQYQYTAPLWPVMAMLYPVVIIGSLFASSKRFFKELAIIVGVLALITEMLDYYTFSSVWCFFAGVTSSLICGYVYWARAQGGAEGA